MARYFSRVALPNALVEKLKETTFDLIKKRPQNRTGGRSPPHEYQIHLYWVGTPMTRRGPYQVRITIVCNNQQATEAVDRLLIETGGSAVVEGATVSINVSSADATLSR